MGAFPVEVESRDGKARFVACILGIACANARLTC